MYKKNLYMEIEKVIVHPNYKAETARNDIAIIKLKQPLSFSETTQPACLGLDYQEKYDGPMTVSYAF